MRITQLLDTIRVKKGPFFVARLGLRVRFSISDESLPDREEYERQILEACRSLGYEPTLNTSSEKTLLVPQNNS